MNTYMTKVEVLEPGARVGSLAVVSIDPTAKTATLDGVVYALTDTGERCPGGRIRGPIVTATAPDGTTLRLGFTNPLLCNVLWPRATALHLLISHFETAAHAGELEYPSRGAYAGELADVHCVLVLLERAAAQFLLSARAYSDEDYSEVEAADWLDTHAHKVVREARTFAAAVANVEAPPTVDDANFGAFVRNARRNANDARDLADGDVENRPAADDATNPAREARES